MPRRDNQAVVSQRLRKDIAKRIRQMVDVAQSEAFEACTEEDVAGAIDVVRERLNNRVFHQRRCHNQWHH